MLDLTSLQNALDRLKESLDYCASDLANADPRLAGLFRAAAIQAFEYSYDLSFKMLKRYLKEFEGSPEVVMQMPFRDVIRRAAEMGFVATPQEWFEYRELRNATSHAYNEDKAEQVFRKIPQFYQSAAALLKDFEAYEHERCRR